MVIKWEDTLDASVRDRIKEWFDMQDGREKRYKDLVIIRDVNNEEVAAGKLCAIEDAGVYEWQEQTRDLENDGRLIYKLELEKQERFPLRVYIRNPYKIPAHDIALVRDRREITLDLFRQLVSYGIENIDDGDADGNRGDILMASSRSSV